MAGGRRTPPCARVLKAWDSPRPAWRSTAACFSRCSPQREVENKTQRGGPSRKLAGTGPQTAAFSALLPIVGIQAGRGGLAASRAGAPLAPLRGRARLPARGVSPIPFNPSTLAELVLRPLPRSSVHTLYGGIGDGGVAQR